eukprot:10194141-Karenia_brevis.AAC.1
MTPRGSISAAGSETRAKACRSLRTALWPRVLGPGAHKRQCDPHGWSIPPQQAHGVGLSGPAAPSRSRTGSSTVALCGRGS